MNVCKRIIVIDDDHGIRVSLKEALESDGHTVLTCSNGKDAFETLKVEGNPALIFLDIHMPIMSGHEFFGLLRLDEGMRDIPVVVMSAAADLEDFKKICPTVRKPFDLDVLLKVAKTYCCIDT